MKFGIGGEERIFEVGDAFILPQYSIFYSIHYSLKKSSLQNGLNTRRETGLSRLRWENHNKVLHNWQRKFSKNRKKVLQNWKGKFFKNGKESAPKLAKKILQKQQRKCSNSARTLNNVPKIWKQCSKVAKKNWKNSL